MSTPLIGIPSFTDNSAPDKMPPRFSMSRPYITALLAVGAAPIIIPLDMGETTLRAIYERLDGLFLAGGGDMNPETYRAEKAEQTDGIDLLRDEAELILTRWALADRLPILGVCRGVQALNVAAGGSLIQDVDHAVPHAIRHQYFPDKPRSYVAHDVATVSGTRLASILGGAASVNSFHHQAVKDVAPHFRVSASAEDGVIEAIEHENGSFAVGVQWHPESLIESDAKMRALFEAFVAQTA